MYHVKNHDVVYTPQYTKEDDMEGLQNLYWSQFSCKCSRCDVSSGKNFMERLPVYILDDISREERMRFYIDLAYVCNHQAYELPILSKSSHRVGLGVRVKCTDDKQRLKLIRGLIVRGVTRYHIDKEFVYYDTDSLKPMQFKVIGSNYYGT